MNDWLVTVKKQFRFLFYLCTQTQDMEILNLDIKKKFFAGLNECQKRHYAAILSNDLGYGGQIAISKALGVDADTIRRGMRELDSNEPLLTNRIRKVGGGRKKNAK